MPALSILELGRVREGFTRADALNDARRLAQHAEALGYKRFWVAEHHAMEGVAGGATSVVLAHAYAELSQPFYDNGPNDKGRWWIKGDRLCQQFTSWYKGAPMCFELIRTGDKRLKWIRDNGETGTARIGSSI